MLTKTKTQSIQIIPPYKTFLPLINKQAKKCWDQLPNPKFCEFEDLVNEGIVTYFCTCKKFDPTKNIKFITYFYRALWWEYDMIRNKAYRANRVKIDSPSIDCDLYKSHYETKEFDLVAIFKSTPSRDAFILARELIDPSTTLNIRLNKQRRTVRLNLTIKHLGFSKEYGEKLFDEIKEKIVTKV